MNSFKTLGVAGAATLVMLAAACGEKETPTQPAPAAPTVQAPALEAPATDTQLDTLRPTVSVRNASSDQTGARTYEFQISDNNAFTSANASNVPGFASSISATAVPEGQRHDQLDAAAGSAADHGVLLARTGRPRARRCRRGRRPGRSDRSWWDSTAPASSTIR